MAFRYLLRNNAQYEPSERYHMYNINGNSSLYVTFSFDSLIMNVSTPLSSSPQKPSCQFSDPGSQTSYGIPVSQTPLHL